MESWYDFYTGATLGIVGMLVYAALRPIDQAQFATWLSAFIVMLCLDVYVRIRG